MEIVVLRLGHRLPRDERISTHVALVARAFGAGRMIYSGQHDGGLESSVSRLVERWGKGGSSGSRQPVPGSGSLVSGSGFSVSYEKNFRKVIRDYKGNGFIVLHLTMYGTPIVECPVFGVRNPEHKTADSRLAPGNRKLLIVVGSEAVPGDIWDLADYNVSVTNQPHSEVAALAIILDRLMEGKELEREFDARFKGKVKIEPSEKGKRVVENG